MVSPQQAPPSSDDVKWLGDALRRAGEAANWPLSSWQVMERHIAHLYEHDDPRAPISWYHQPFAAYALKVCREVTRRA